MGLRNKIRGLREIWAFENRWPLAIARLFFPRESLQVYRFGDIEILTDHAGGDANGARELFTTQMYRGLLPMIERTGPLNVLDLGANNGGFPLLLKANGFDLKKVVAVELNPQTFVRMQFNLARNLSCEVAAVNAAVCGRAGTLTVPLGRGSVSDNIYGSGTGKKNQMVEVTGTTLDHLYEEYFDGETVDICKIDIEGAEFEVLSEPGHSSLAQCQYVIMEIHQREGMFADTVLEAMSGLGFRRPELPAGSDPTVHFFERAPLPS
jgi:FkbM family methyltransferase